jgi:predicted nucleotidyltransferase
MVANTLWNNKIKLSLREKILKYLIENKKPVSIMQISNQLEVDYKNTFKTINNLPQIIQNRIGNTNLIELKLIPDLEIYSVECKRTGQFLQENKHLSLIKKDIELLAYPFLIVLIFGSYTKNNQTKKSDIDICVISDNQSKTRELISKLNLFPLRLEVHDFSIKEFESMLETKKENIAKEIIKSNVLLYGTDNYYNLISRWETRNSIKIQEDFA